MRYGEINTLTLGVLSWSDNFANTFGNYCMKVVTIVMMNNVSSNISPNPASVENSMQDTYRIQFLFLLLSM